MEPAVTASINRCAIAAVLAVVDVFVMPAVFGQNAWVAVYALCFAAIPICAAMAGAMFYTLRKAAVHPLSIGEAQTHGFWAGVGSPVLFLRASLPLPR
jgi:hypothetical protein